MNTINTPTMIIPKAMINAISGRNRNTFQPSPLKGLADFSPRTDGVTTVDVTMDDVLSSEDVECSETVFEGLEDAPNVSVGRDGVNIDIVLVISGELSKSVLDRKITHSDKKKKIHEGNHVIIILHMCPAVFFQ